VGGSPIRTFHPGKEDEFQLNPDVSLTGTAKWEADQLVVVYKIEQGRELRYSYSTTASPRQLIVDVQFVERGGHDEVRHVYVPTTSNEAPAPLSRTPPPAAPAPSPRPPALPERQQAPVIVSRDAQLRGITKLGLVVEGLGSQAAACGLSQNGLESTVGKSLSDAGVKYSRNSDDDTYIYVNVKTISAPAGLCVSSYDVYLYTHATATLSYQNAPALLQVELLHQSGLAGGAPGAHAGSVLQGVKQYADQFAARVRDANK
jgi:hypothetical protein